MKRYETGQPGATTRARPAQRAQAAPLTRARLGHPSRGTRMLASTPPPDGGPGPAPPAPSLSDEGNNDHDDSSPPLLDLLDLLERFPDLVLKEVLERLDPTARASLARTGSALWDVVFPISISPFGLLRAETPPAAGVARVFKLVDFLGTAERLAWAKANGCPWDAETCCYAARGGNLEALKWARQHGCPWNAGTCHGAARGGHLEVLQWAREHGGTWCANTSFAAAGGGHLSVLRWAREQECPWNDWTCLFAARGGHLAVLQWARAHGCPWRKHECELDSRDHPETLAWVRQQPA